MFYVAVTLGRVIARVSAYPFFYVLIDQRGGRGEGSAIAHKFISEATRGLFVA